MKKVNSLLLALFFIVHANATTTIIPPKIKASEIQLQIGKSGISISLLDLSTISLRDFQQLSGRKLKFFEKITFKIAQNKLRHSIDADGTINNKNIERAFKKGFFSAHDFHLGGFALGFFFSLIGVLIAYLINDDLKSDRTYWAWRGFLAGLLIAITIAQVAAM